MKRFLSLLSIALFAMIGVTSLHANDPDPYANTMESSDYTTFNPSGNFSLQANLANGQSIEVRNANGKGFVYRTTMPGVFSFLVNLSTDKVAVYRLSALLEEIDVTTSTEPITVGEDLINAQFHDPILGMGIYSSKNLIKNPGFETGELWEGQTDSRQNPSDWYVNAANQIATRCRANNFTVSATFEPLSAISEGAYAFMIHNDATPMWQELSGLKPSTTYKVAFRQMAHMDTSSPTSYTSMIMADSVNFAADNSNVLGMTTYTSAPQGFGNYLDVSYRITTPSTLPNEVYFVVRKTDLSSSCIQNFDFMTMQEITESDIYYNGIISTVDQITWEDGLQVPQGGSEDVYVDVTSQYFTNPSFENIEITLHPSSVDPATGNSGVWVPYGWSVAYSTAANATPSLWDQALITDGPSAIDQSQSPPRTSDTGFSSVNGTYFYYYRTRWMANQDFTISQTLKNLEKGAYNLSVFIAADQANPATVRVRGLLMNSEEVANIAGSTAEMQNITLPFNVLSDGDSAVISVSVSRVADSQARLILDHFQLVYRGEPNEEEVLEALKNTLTEQRGEYGLYYYDVPSGIRYELDAADDLANIAQSTQLPADYSAAVYAYNRALDLAIVAKPVFMQLSSDYGVADELAGLDLPGLDAFRSYLNEFVYVFDDVDSENQPTYYYIEDLNRFSAELAEAVRTYGLSIIENATETSYVEITEVVVSAWNFTSPDGDPSAEADRVSTNWLTNNVSNGGDFRLNTINSKNCWNNWSNDFTSMDVYQEITDLPEGVYYTTCVTTSNGVAHDQHAYVSSTVGVGVSPAARYQYPGSDFNAESDWESLTTEGVFFPEGSTLRIGMASTSGGGTSGWFCMTDFRLFYRKATSEDIKGGLNDKITEAEALLAESPEKIMNVEKAALSNALTEAKAAETTTEVVDAYAGITTAIDNAKVSVETYDDVYPWFAEAETLLAEQGYSEEQKQILSNVIETQQAVLADSQTDATILAEVKPVLIDAIDVYKNSRLRPPFASYPHDLSEVLKNADIEDAASNTAIPEWWTINRVDGDKNSTTGQHYSGDEVNRYIDSYNSTAGRVRFSATQTLLNIPNGTYRLEFVGRSNGDGAYGYVLASSGTIYTTVIPVNDNVGGSIWEAAEEGSAIHQTNPDDNGSYRGWGWAPVVIDNINVWDNKMTVGVTCDSLVSYGTQFAGNWFSADEFRLYYTSENYVNTEGVEDIHTGNSPYNVYVGAGRKVIVEGAESFQILKLDGTFVRPDASLETGAVYSILVDGKEIRRVIVTE